MRNLSSPKSELRNLVPALPQPRRRWRPWRCRRSCSATSPTRSRRSIATRGRSRRRSRRPPAGGGDRVVPRADPVPGPLRRPVAPPRAGGRPAAPRAAADQRRAQRGHPAFRRTPELGERLDQRRRAGDVVGEPEHAAVAARPAPRAAGHRPPGDQQIAPYQTVCNYLVYFFNPLGTHLSETVPGGTQERIKAKLANLTQANTLGLTESCGRWTCPPTRTRSPAPSKRCTRSTAARRSTSRATDCQSGQTGYPNRLVTDPLAARLVGWRVHRRRQPRPSTNTPGLAGGTYKSRQLGIDNLKDVP